MNSKLVNNRDIELLPLRDEPGNPEVFVDSRTGNFPRLRMTSTTELKDISKFLFYSMNPSVLGKDALV